MCADVVDHTQLYIYIFYTDIGRRQTVMSRIHCVLLMAILLSAGTIDIGPA